MLLQDGLEGGRVEGCVGGDLVDDVSQVGEEVALVAVGEDGGHAGVVELDILVVHAHEMHGSVFGHEGCEGIRNDLGDGALRGVSTAEQGRWIIRTSGS